MEGFISKQLQTHVHTKTHTFFSKLKTTFWPYFWSLVKIALVASAVPCAPTMERTQLAVIPSHKRIAPSLEAVTYMLPVVEYLTWWPNTWNWMYSWLWIYLWKGVGITYLKSWKMDENRPCLIYCSISSYLWNICR